MQQFLYYSIALPGLVLSDAATSYCIFVLIVASSYFCWRYWKLMRAYAKFPARRMEVEWIVRIMLGRYPKNVPFTSVMFQEVIKLAKRFEKDGFCILWFFRPYLLVFNKEFYKRLYTDSAVGTKSALYEMATGMVGNGLLTSNDESWRSHRKLLNPVFYVGMLKGKMHIFNEHAADLVAQLEEVAGKPTHDLIGILKQCSFNVLAESILGLKLKDEKYGSKIVNYVKAIDEVLHSLVYRVARPWLYWNFSLPFFSSGRKYLKLCDDLQTFTQEILLEMKSSVIASGESQDDPECDVDNKNSFARILLERHLKDPTFTIQDVQDHVTTTMAAGHDTTSYTLMWCLYLLGLHPEIQEKAFKEVDTLRERDVSYDDLYALKYLECIIKETLRLYTIVPMYGRKLNKEVQCGEYTIPKGTEVAFLLYLLHRNPEIYPNPEKFDPERFSENSDIRPWTYLPFAEGYRSCIGKKFALMEVKVILAHIIRRFKIKTLETIEDPGDMDWIVIMKTTKPVRLLFTLRHSRSVTRGR